MTGLDPKEEERRRRLHAQGYDDERAAKKCRIARVSYTSWRISRDLPVNRKRHRLALSQKEEDRRWQLWGKGLPDVVAGPRVGITAGAFRAWREKKGLAANRYLDWLYEDRWDLWERGWTDDQIAREHLVTPDAIRKWREAEWLEANE